MTQDKNFTDTSYEDATGEVPYNMTNDYMFRAVLQENNYVLKGLIGALLHLNPETITSAEITNPIILGEAVSSKEIRLDINVMLNNSRIINLEMQVANMSNWRNRSVLYLCRIFDKLNHGEKYKDLKPVIHIGFLDHTLSGMIPEFYATYKFANIKNHQVYSDNLTLAVVNLNKTELATDEDKEYEIDKWAKLFKAKTWEAVKMLAKENNYINEASRTMYKMCADAMVRVQCLDREEFRVNYEGMETEIAEMREELAETIEALTEAKEELMATKDELNRKLLENANLLEWAKAHGYDG